MKEHMADWRIHALAFVLTVIAEFIGTKKFSFGPLSFSLFPMLYVLILGAILGIAKMIPQKMMTEASPYIGISVMMLTAKIASTIGPNLGGCQSRTGADPSGIRKSGNCGFSAPDRRICIPYGTRGNRNLLLYFKRELPCGRCR